MTVIVAFTATLTTLIGLVDNIVGSLMSVGSLPSTVHPTKPKTTSHTNADILTDSCSRSVEYSSMDQASSGSYILFKLVGAELSIRITKSH